MGFEGYTLVVVVVMFDSLKNDMNRHLKISAESSRIRVGSTHEVAYFSFIAIMFHKRFLSTHSCDRALFENTKSDLEWSTNFQFLITEIQTL